MEEIVNNAEVRVWFAGLERPYSLNSPFGNEDYVTLLVVNDTTITPNEQAHTSDQLVGSSCRYAVCTGHQCSSWDDSIDMAFIESDPNFDPPDERFVMTTWHEDEPIEDLVEYLRWSTVFDDFVPKNFLVLFLGESPHLQKRALEAALHLFS